jgi:membrane protease YdiL (CAAX protease family)
VLPDNKTLKREVLLVFALSLGASGVYAVVSIAASITAGTLGTQSAHLNQPRAPASRPTLDLIYQLLAIGFALVPVLLVMHFLTIGGERATQVLGIDGSQPVRDLVRGMVLAALIGGSGLALYLLAFHAGVNLRVVPTSLYAVWWRIPVLLLSAAENAILEETLVAGYLVHRLGQLGWRPWRAVFASATLRGSYHLYQGFGGFVGNFVMGVIFARLYQRWGRTLPMIIAHTLIDSVTFVGYVLLVGKVSWLP